MMETLEYLGIAFVCSVLLIIMSKIILQSLIRRPADYYDAEELRQEELMLNAGGISLASEHETTPEGEIMETFVQPEWDGETLWYVSMRYIREKDAEGNSMPRREWTHVQSSCLE